MMIFWDIPTWMGIITWLVLTNLAVVVSAHLWLWFANKLKE
jgi:hypothetical protein